MKMYKKLKSPGNKGKGFEREVVNYLNKEYKLIGLRARRMWGSDGRSAGFDKNVDIVLESAKYPYYKFQCKRLKKLPNYLGLESNLDGVIFREDKGETFILMTLNKFIGTYNTNSEMIKLDNNDTEGWDDGE